MRIRTIKPEFWANEHLAKLSDFTLLLAIGLLNYADDEGYFNANPALIRAALFPLREHYGSIPVAVTELSNQGYLVLYSGDDGRTYGHIVNFAKHQVINKPYKSKIKDLCKSPVGLLHLSGSDTVVLPSGTGNREQGKDLPKPAKPVRARDELFDALASVSGADPKELTSGAASACGVALAEIRKASKEVTVEEINRRAANYASHFADAAITPSALAKHWATCANRRASTNAAPQYPQPTYANL